MCVACPIRVPEDIADTMQTNGVELDEIVYQKSTFKIREVGGTFVEVICLSCVDTSGWQRDGLTRVASPKTAT